MDIFIRLGQFFIEIFFQLFAFLFMLRFILKLVKMEFGSPGAYMIFRVTDRFITPLQRLFKDVRDFEVATLLLLYLLSFLKIILKMLLVGQFMMNTGIFLWALVDLVAQFISFYIFTIMAQALLSFVMSPRLMPMVDLLHRITSPLLRPLQRIVPPVMNFDLTPMIAIVLLYLLQLMVLEPLLAQSIRLTL